MEPKETRETTKKTIAVLFVYLIVHKSKTSNLRKLTTSERVSAA